MRDGVSGRPLTDGNGERVRDFVVLLLCGDFRELAFEVLHLLVRLALPASSALAARARAARTARAVIAAGGCPREVLWGRWMDLAFRSPVVAGVASRRGNTAVGDRLASGLERQSGK